MISLLMDSGAFSAKTQGVEIDIDDYAMFLIENKDVIDLSFNLDVIDDGRASYKNWLYLKEVYNLETIPVYHMGTDIKWLHQYLDQTDYIGVGAISHATSDQRRMGLDYLWRNHLIKPDGYPKLKVHGLGLVSTPLLKKFPWYSVDTSSWVESARRGGIYVPKLRNGTYDYLNGYRVVVSYRNPDKADKGRHYQSISNKQQELVRDYLHYIDFKIGESDFKSELDSYTLKENEKWWGKKGSKNRKVEIIKEPGVSNNLRMREVVNLIYYLNIQKALPKWPWPMKSTYRSIL